MNKMITKKIILTLIVAVTCTAAYAQRMKYKDIYGLIGIEPAEHTLIKLNEYQSADPEFPNTYVQTAVIKWKWLQEEDPFLNYKYVRQLIYDTRLYLGLAISKIKADDKEVKTNRDYYTNLGVGNLKTVTQEGVLGYLDNIMSTLNEYDEHVTAIIDNFNLAIDKYNDCTQTFNKIVGHSNNYKNLLVTNSDELRSEIKKLSMDFDSVKLCFGLFRNELANYPIKQYDQKLDIKPIETYRLEGLTSSNFIQPRIPVWDYQGWCKDALKLLDGNIKDIKTNTEKAIKDIRARVAKLQRANAETDSIQNIIPSNKILNLTEKYDYESLLSSALRYEVSKANLQIASLRSTNNIDNPESYNSDYNQKANYYYDLYLMVRTCKNNLRAMNARINDKSLHLHEQTITNLYGNTSKFSKTYKTEQEKEIDKIQEKNFEHFRAFTVDQYTPMNASYTFKEKEINAAPYEIPFDEADQDEYTTVFSCKDGTGNRLIGGYRKTSDVASTAFVAKGDPDGQLLWATDITMPAGQNAIIQLAPSKTEGLYALATNGTKSSVIKLDKEGKVVSKTDLTSTMYPVAFTLDEIAATVSVVSKGANGNADTDTYDDVVLETVSLGQKNPAFSKYFKLKGKVADIIKSSTGYVIVCNYTALNVNGKEFTSKSDIASVAISGDNITANACNSKEEIRAIKAFQINAETINITGAYDNLNSKTSSDEKPAYLLLSTRGKFFYKN